MDDPNQSANSEPSKGDSAFLPVVIAAGIALIVILAVAAFILKERGRKLIPKVADPHPTSLSQPAPVLAPPSKIEARRTYCLIVPFPPVRPVEQIPSAIGTRIALAGTVNSPTAS
jgi:hypothetical protein